MMSSNNLGYCGLLVVCLTLTVSLQQFNTVKAASILRDYPTNVQQGDNLCQRSICESIGCVREAHYFAAIMNDAIDPCDDFYEFACGNFIKNKELLDHSSVISSFSLAQTFVSKDLNDEIMSDIKPNELNAFKKIKTYYQNCMDESSVEKAGIKTLLDILDKIGGWPVVMGNNWNRSQFNWKDNLSIEEAYLFSFPVIIKVGVDNTNSTNSITKIYNGDTAITRTFIVNATDTKLLQGYYEYMVNSALALGASEDRALSEMRRLLQFELKLFSIKTPPEELLDYPTSESRLTVKELIDRYPSIPWLKLLNNIFNRVGIVIDEDEIVDVIDPKFLRRLERLLRDTPKRIIANYMAWRVVYSTIMYLPRKFRSIAENYTNVLEGTTVASDRSSWCIFEVMEAFPISLSAMYIKHHFNSKIKKDVMNMTLNIKNQTRKSLQEVDWMDEETRSAALEKLKVMNAVIGYEDELADDQKVEDYYQELNLTRGPHVIGGFNLTIFLTKQNYRALRKPLDVSAWSSTQNVAYVNAYNILQRNAVGIPAGFLRMFFRPDRPQYLNYGSTGTVIGHEITHSFDNQGRKYDKKGNQNNWWRPETEEKFFQKTKCLIDQYNNFNVTQVGLTVNGVTTQGENIADNGGFKAAYYAYNEWAKQNNITEPRLPSLNYTQQQMFWISAASNWCSKERPEYLKALISTNEHSPNAARIIISFSNIKEFAEDFQCKVGSRMNPEKKCIIW